jgi:hypothetical protein
MNPSALVPALTALTVAILPAVFGLSRRRVKSPAEMYVYSPGFKLFSWLGSICFILIPYLFILVGSEIGVVEIIYAEAIGVVLAVGSAYLEKYSIRVNLEYIEIGAFAKKIIYYRDISSARINVSGRGSRFLVIKYKAARVVVSDYVNGIDNLALQINKKIAGQPTVAQPTE